ncbi:MAG: UDP-N-acetylmuramate dehydrogenase [Fibromonadales bacterium]|nr:UDP-N-acetylmuramate dehydrogenase [Fibromonadales bacterium]
MIAITGLIGSGKSLVADIVRGEGFEVLDADALAHELYKEDAELRRKIAENFGKEALNESGINRKYIADLVFCDEQKLKLLESIVHPVLQSEIEKRNPPFIEAAVLHKWPEFSKKMQEIWIVEADEDARRQRLLRKGLTEGDVERRMQTQKPLRVESGERRLENNGTEAECRDEVLQVLGRHIPKGIKRNVLLKKYCTFKIGGFAKFFAEPESVEEILELLDWCRKFKIAYFILGGGSNVLFSDKGFDGLVIKIGKNFIAGKSLHSVIQEAAAHGLGGIEKLQGIPGTIGGAIYMNAGAHSQQISDCIKNVTSIAQNGELITRTKEQCEFSYRSSIFKKSGQSLNPVNRGSDNDEIILFAEFDFIPVSEEIINKNRKEVLAWRKEKQPLQYPNAGSIFKNPASHLSAGALIDACGLKGSAVGDAQVSELHANFIVNRGEATAKDVKALMKKIIDEVQKNHDVALEPEIICVPF